MNDILCDASNQQGIHHTLINVLLIDPSNSLKSNKLPTNHFHHSTDTGLYLKQDDRRTLKHDAH